MRFLDLNDTGGNNPMLLKGKRNPCRKMPKLFEVERIVRKPRIFTAPKK
jgi:hypothetical protein